MLFLRIPASGQHKLLPLLGSCFPGWAKYEMSGIFPVEMSSFAAVDGGRYVAHCGLVEFTVSDGNGGRIPLGGLACVCTDPDFRHRGIAATLCHMAIEYARSKKLAGLALFTSFAKVYAKNNFWDYPIFTPKIARWKTPGDPQMMKNGKALDKGEKAKIITLYKSGFDFPGKVFRVENPDSRSVFSWGHHFDKFEFAVGNGCYAAGGGNLICEVGGDLENMAAFLPKLPRENGATIFALPENSPYWRIIAELADLEEAEIFFHGPMVIDTDERALFATRSDIYFPLADRF